LYRRSAAVSLKPQQEQSAGIRNAMWIIVKTRKGKNSFLTETGDWTRNRDNAERFDQFDFAVTVRDRAVPPSERRGVGVISLN
jgi:hypothetical protein